MLPLGPMLPVGPTPIPPHGRAHALRARVLHGSRARFRLRARLRVRGIRRPPRVGPRREGAGPRAHRPPVHAARVPGGVRRVIVKPDTRVVVHDGPEEVVHAVRAHALERRVIVHRQTERTARTVPAAPALESAPDPHFGRSAVHG